MNITKFVYDIGYRYFKMPYDVGPAEELVKLVESGRIPPCRAIDFGCGTGRNAVFLAQHDFEVTGVDYAFSAIAQARQRAEAAGVRVKFVLDDLTNLQNIKGPFDLLMDIGVLDSLYPKGRDLYVGTVLHLTQPGSLFLVSGWEWPQRWWERLFLRNVALAPGEARQRFGEAFEIEQILAEANARAWGPTYFTGLQKPPGFAVYLMIRKSA